MIISQVNRFARERWGNMTITFALSLIPMAFLMGMTMDYPPPSRERSSSTQRPTRPHSPQ